MREIELRMIDPFRTAGSTTTNRRAIILELRDTDGTIAWSECVAESLPTYSPETVDTCWLALSDWIIPAMLGRDFESPRDAHRHLETTAGEHRMARAAVEMGYWELEALRRNASLAALLASECGASPRNDVETGIALGMESTPAALAEKCRRAADEGYRRIKIKIEPGRDIEYARAALDAVSADLPITVDANSSYSSRPAEVAALDALGLSMIEQPLGRDDLLEHAELQSQLKTAICLDESITDVGRVNEMIALQSARIVNLKPGRVGGFTESLAIHARCIEKNISLWCGGMLETGIGRAYNVALASLPGFTLPGDLSPSSRYWERDIITPKWTMHDGRVSVPLHRPGIGVDVDEAFVESIALRTEEFRAA